MTIAFCAMLFVVSAQNWQTMPSAVLVKNKCVNCIKFDTICRFPEYFPRFPGGIDSLNAFLLRETQYPNDPFLDVTGTVVVQFLVEKDGSVTLPQVIVPLYPDCDKEAFRVIQLMPKWEPATVNGVPVRCFYQVPVRFWR